MSKIVDILISPISLIVGDKIGHAITGAVLIAAGIATGNFGLAALGASMLMSSLAPKPKANQANISRLTVSLDANAPRKISFGHTALASDMVYGAYSGTNQDHFDQIICVASHKVDAIEEIWFDNQQAWTSGGGVTGSSTGYLTVDVRLEGTRINGIAVDSTWTTNSTLTGCAYIHLRYKLTGNSSNTSSPFASSIPSRMTIRGKGAFVYDPRLDSNVSGGSGSQRAADQTTWTWDDNASRNPALQLLFYLLGWRIQNPSNSAWKLAVGRGIPAARLDLPSFITAANVCDETVALAAGGTEPRYRSDGVFSEGDDPSTVLTNLLGAMNATLRDSGGKLSLVCYKNDLGSPVASFTSDDILGNETWDQSPPVNQVFNIVRGRYTNPSNTALYQLADYPEAILTSPDGIDRIDSVDFSNVQSSSQAQRLANQRLERAQYQGKYAADFGFRALQVSVGDVVQLSHVGLGWSNKLFRVTGQSISTTGRIKMTFVEENAAIYAWAAADTPPVTPGAPTVYDPLNDPTIARIGGISMRADGVLVGASASSVQVDATQVLNGAAEAGADKTANQQVQVVYAPNTNGVPINADNSGAIVSGQLPMALARPTVTKGGTNVTGDNLTTYSVSGISASLGTVTVDNGTGSSTKGQVTIPTGITGSGSFNLVISYNGVVQATLPVIVTVSNAPPSSAGGSGATTASFTVNDTVTSASFVQVGSTVTVTAASGKSIHAAFGDTYNVGGVSVSASAVMKWQYSPTGTGTWSDIASPLTGTSAACDSDFNQSPGSITCNQTVTPSAGTYDVRLVAEKSGTASGIFFDTATAYVSVS